MHHVALRFITNPVRAECLPHLQASRFAPPSSKRELGISWLLVHVPRVPRRIMMKTELVGTVARPSPPMINVAHLSASVWIASHAWNCRRGNLRGLSRTTGSW